MQYFSLFHKSSKQNPSLPEDENQWPESWKRIQYKVYEGAPEIKLSFEKEASFAKDLKDVLLHRATSRDFDAKQHLTLSEISTLLKLGCGETGTLIEGSDGLCRRTYPSAGALYPIEVYVHIAHTIKENAPQGLYHYRPDTHSLEIIGDGLQIPEGLFSAGWQKEAACTLFITAVLPRSAHKYRDRGYRFALLEAGHVAQNLMLVGASLNIKSAEIGGVQDVAIEDFLDIDGVTETVCTVLVMGK